MRMLFAWLLVAIASPSIARVHEHSLAVGGGQNVAVHCETPNSANRAAVLFIHGASFPTLLAAGFQFEKDDSWMHFMAKRGFLACGLDFVGFGASSRPAAMSLDPKGAPPIDRAADAAAQISAAAKYILSQPGVDKLHLIAHSWGTLPAALYASAHADVVRSLILFGPVVPEPNYQPNRIEYSWFSLSPDERYKQLQFASVLPHGMYLLEPAVDRKWAREFAASASDGRPHTTDPLRIPAGPLADLEAVKGGELPYRPESLRMPVFVVYGNYDTVVNDAEADQFLSRFTNSPLKWRLRIDPGTHVMHLEAGRKSLYRAALAFIDAVS